MKPWLIFPVSVGAKVPLVSDPVVIASDNKEAIERWSELWPGCNWGVALERSGLLVLDVDKKDRAKGFQSLAKLPKIGATLTVRTPSGGRHLYFKTTAQIERPQHDFWPGIDLPSWVLIGGSHIDGVGSYRVEESDAVAQAPQWLLNVLVSPTLAKAYLTRRESA